MSKAARDLQGYIEQALEGASRIRVWLIDNKPSADEARKPYGEATEMFTGQGAHTPAFIPVIWVVSVATLCHARTGILRTATGTWMCAVSTCRKA